MIDRVAFRMEVAGGNAAMVDNPLEALAHMFQEQLVDRLRLGADYGNLRDANGNVVGAWNVYLDHDEEDV